MGFLLLPHCCHGVAVASALKSTPMVSALANSSKIFELPAGFFTMAPSNATLASSLRKGILEKGWKGQYAVAVDRSCIACRDFADQFSKAAGKPVFEIDVNLKKTRSKEIAQRAAMAKIAYLLLPNYSKLSGKIIKEVGEIDPTLKFVGGDGWGDGTYGYLTKFGLHKDQKGMCVRPGAPASVLLKSLDLRSLSYSWRGSDLAPSMSSILMIETLRKLSAFLCSKKPRSRENFVKALKRVSRDFFSSTSGVGIYSLENGKLNFSRSVR